MKQSPEYVGGARVVRCLPIDERHGPTGNCRYIVVDELQGPAAGVAICHYEDDDESYLFGGDAEWNSITDTCMPRLQKP
jgi:hypothetical protein